MKNYNATKHHRRSIRLGRYDYTQPGPYFVTVTTRHKECWFDDDSLRAIVEQAWHKLPHRFPKIRLDEFVVMPKHVHCVLWLAPSDPTVVGARLNRAPTEDRSNPIGMPYSFDRLRPTLGQVVRAFKAVVTRRIRLTGETGFAWQRNYYEHIIRNERELTAIRQYIRDNPAHWVEDSENPQHSGKD